MNGKITHYQKLKWRPSVDETDNYILRSTLR
jgi:hypothetical protein